MLKSFKDLVQDLQGNFELIAEFLENPKEVISTYHLSSEEEEALLSRSFDKLATLCGSQQLSAGVLSNAHTPRCNNGGGAGTAHR